MLSGSQCLMRAADRARATEVSGRTDPSHRSVSSGRWRRPIAERWSREIARSVQDKDLVTRLGRDGIEPIGSPPDEFSRKLRSEIAQWGEVVKAARIKF